MANRGGLFKVSGMAGADFEVEQTADGAVLSLTGDWTSMGLGRVYHRLQRALDGQPVARLDISGLGRFDTSGALVLVQTTGGRLPKGAWKTRPETGRVYAMVEKLERDVAEPLPRADLLTRLAARIGRGVYDIGREAWLSMAFFGHLLVAVGTAVSHPGRIRWPAWVSQMDRAGLDALPIIAVTSFFIGAVIAFLGADLLTQFGAQVFAVELIGVAVFREFGVVLTAVLLAGRSASSFAAEIGAMKMNQEIDAMRVMGVDPFQALVIPRLAALLIMLPLLTFIAVISGLLGGLLVTWTQLDLGPAFFIQRIEQNVGATHFWVGMSKAPVFAVIVAAIGCRQGLAVGGDVVSLGQRVTAAVVQAIFAIIMIDAVFAMIYLEAGI